MQNKRRFPANFSFRRYNSNTGFEWSYESKNLIKFGKKTTLLRGVFFNFCIFNILNSSPS